MKNMSSENPFVFSSLIAGLMLIASSTFAAGEFESMKKAAEQGDAAAQFNLGQIYYSGEEVAQDYAEAMRWYRLAGDQGHMEAQYSLGVMYTNGEGAPKSRGHAMRWVSMGSTRYSSGD